MHYRCRIFVSLEQFLKNHLHGFGIHLLIVWEDSKIIIIERKKYADTYYLNPEVFNLWAMAQ